LEYVLDNFSKAEKIYQVAADKNDIQKIAGRQHELKQTLEALAKKNYTATSKIKRMALGNKLDNNQKTLFHIYIIADVSPHVFLTQSAKLNLDQNHSNFKSDKYKNTLLVFVEL